MSKNEIQMEGLERMATNLLGLLFANRLLNPFTLGQTSRSIGVSLVNDCKDFQLCVPQMIFGRRTIKLFNMPLFSTIKVKLILANQGFFYRVQKTFGEIVVRNIFHKQE
jgi:hypothetical protein